MEILKQNPIENVYVNWTEDNLYKPVVVIIGPKDTPYEKGFYFIKFNFCDNFPFQPPKATFLTTDGKVRMNPNLYASGKICLSLLGTWSGPQWTSCQNLSTIILSIITILNENPIQNEPGYHNVNPTSKKNKLYNLLITHANIRVGVLQMVQSPPDLFFTDLLQKLFLKNYDYYETICNKNINTIYQKKQKAPIYNWNENINFKKLLKQLNTTKNKLQKK